LPFTGTTACSSSPMDFEEDLEEQEEQKVEEQRKKRKRPEGRFPCRQYNINEVPSYV